MKTIVLLLGALCSLSAHASERELLEKYPKLFQRKKETELTVIHDKGQKIYKDNFKEGDSYDLTRLNNYYPELRVVELEHQLYHSMSYELVALKPNMRVLIGTEEPTWKDGMFASSTEASAKGRPGKLVVGYCELAGCWKLAEKEGKWGPVDLVGNDTLEVNYLGSGKAKTRLSCKMTRKTKKVICGKL